MKESGYKAFGKPVPVNRMENAYKAIREMCPEFDFKLATTIVSKCALAIKKDQPYRILAEGSGIDADIDKLDLTGRYRLLATLLCD